ncbi:MAG TPA: hypothetical protein VNS55_09465 [Nocardioides sp.]|nr:hypothetical protein [Nocardioides sp.]
MIERTRLLQALRLKGRARVDDLAAATGLTADEVAPLLDSLVAEGRAEEARDRFKLTPDGRDELAALLAAERGTVDQDALAAGYHEFDEHNSALKELMTRWQLKDGTTPNDHSDQAYDDAVVADLADLDARFRPLLGRFVALCERLAPYPQRFDRALALVRGGDHSWFAKPLADSYHTVWFELHEDLIGLAGLTRAEEAAAGRAL